MGKRKVLIGLISIAALILVAGAIYFLNGRFHFFADNTTSTSTDSPPECLKVIFVPDSIDSTGETDVGDELLAFFDSVPDGSKIVFKANGIYKINSALSISGRHYLTFDGNGATIKYGGAGTGTQTVDSLFRLPGSSPSSYLTFENFKLVGNSTSPGEYVSGQEYQMAFYIQAASHIDINNNEISNVWGDGFYMSAWSDTIDIYNNHVISCGRDYVTIIAAKNVNIWDNTFDTAPAATLDIEPNYETEGADNIKLVNNTIGYNGLLLAANGVAGSLVSNITVSKNTVETGTLRSIITLETHRQNITFTNNVSTIQPPESYVGKITAILRFYNIDNLTVYGNVQPLIDGVILQYFRNCTNIISDPPDDDTIPDLTPTANPAIADCPETKSSFLSSLNLTDNQVITSNPYIITAKVKDTSLVSKVEFYVDDNLIGTSTLPDVEGNYSCAWDTSKYHSLVKIIVYGSDGTTEEVTRNTSVQLDNGDEPRDGSDIVPVLPKTGEAAGILQRLKRVIGKYIKAI